MSDNTFAITMRVEDIGTKTLPSGKTLRIMRGVADGQYPQTYEVEAWKSDTFEGVGVGQTVRVCGELRGRLHAASGRIYYSLAAESIESMGYQDAVIAVDPMDMIPDRKPEPKQEHAKPAPTPQPQQADLLDEDPPF